MEKGDDTQAYRNMRMALVSCQERFRNMITEHSNLRDPQDYSAWALNQAREGFDEIERALSKPNK